VSSTELSAEIQALLQSEQHSLTSLRMSLSSENSQALQLDDPRYWVWRLASATKSTLAGANPVLFGASVWYDMS